MDTPATLTNVDNTISGSGYLGASPFYYSYYRALNLINEAKGVIDGSGIKGFDLGSSAGSVANAGLIEGTSSSGLTLNGSVTNTGTIEANGGALRMNGTLAYSGVLQAINGATHYLGGTIANTAAGSVIAAAGSALNLNGSIAGGAITTQAGGTLNLQSFGLAIADGAGPNVFTIAQGATKILIKLAGNVNGGTFSVASDGASGIDVTYAPPHGMAQAMAAVGAVGLVSATSWAAAAPMNHPLATLSTPGPG